MKYNPEIHSSVVGNLRRAYAARYAVDSTLTDEAIWEAFESWHSSGDDTILEGMEYAERNPLNPDEIPVEAVECSAPNGIVAYNGELVVDIARGVIYFHDAAAGITRLRVCGLNVERLNAIADNANGFLPELFSIDITRPQLVGFAE